MLLRLESGSHVLKTLTIDWKMCSYIRLLVHEALLSASDERPAKYMKVSTLAAFPRVKRLGPRAERLLTWTSKFFRRVASSKHEPVAYILPPIQPSAREPMVKQRIGNRRFVTLPI